MKNWTWLGVALETTHDEWRARFDRLREAGVHAVLPEVFNNHAAFWASSHLPVRAAVLEELIPLAHAAGLEIHAWIHCMTCNIPAVYEAHPEWYGVNRAGDSTADKPPYVDYYRFLCPSQPEAQAFLQQRLRELAALDGLDGIHLDYIRFPDVILAEALQPKYGLVQDRELPAFDYCYCEVCRADFEAQHGVDPLAMADPTASTEWRQFRADRITQLVNNVLVPIGRAAGKEMTAAVFPNWTHVRQEWHVWHVDGVLPMLYHSFYNEGVEWVAEHCATGIERMRETGGTKPLYSGLFVPALSPEELAEAIVVSRDGGATGIALFNEGAMTEAHWQAFASAARG